MKTRIASDSDKSILLRLDTTNLLRKPYCFTFPKEKRRKDISLTAVSDNWLASKP